MKKPLTTIAFSVGIVTGQCSSVNTTEGQQQRHSADRAGKAVKRTFNNPDAFATWLRKGISWTPSVFHDSKRDLASLKATDCFVADVDHVVFGETEHTDYLAATPCGLPIALLIKTGSHEHGTKLPDGTIKNRGAFRSIYIYDRSLRPGESEAVAAMLANNIGEVFPALDKATSKNVAAFFYGRDDDCVLYKAQTGQLLNVDRLLNQALAKTYDILDESFFSSEELVLLSCCADSLRRKFYEGVKSDRHDFCNKIALDIVTNIDPHVPSETSLTLLAKIRLLVRPDDNQQEADRHASLAADYSRTHSLVPSRRATTLPSAELTVEQLLEIRKKAETAYETLNTIDSFVFWQLLKKATNISWAETHFDDEGTYVGQFSLGDVSLLCGLSASEYEALTPESQKFLAETQQESWQNDYEAAATDVSSDSPPEILDDIGIFDVCRKYSENLDEKIAKTLPTAIIQAYDLPGVRFPLYQQAFLFYSALGVIASSISCATIHAQQTIQSLDDIELTETSEPPNLFVFLVGSPGAGKTPLIKSIAAPLAEIDQERREIRLKIHKKAKEFNERQSQNKKAAAKNKKNPEFLNLKQQLADAIAEGDTDAIAKLTAAEIADDYEHDHPEDSRTIELNHDRFFTGATSAQELIAQAAENHRRDGTYIKDGALGLWWPDDEASGILSLLTQSQPLRACALKLATGDGITAESITARSQTAIRQTSVPYTAVSLTWGVQPQALREALNLIDQDDRMGFAARFLMVMLETPTKDVAAPSAFDENAVYDDAIADARHEINRQEKFKDAVKAQYERLLELFPRPEDSIEALLKEPEIIPRHRIRISAKGEAFLKVFVWNLEFATRQSDLWRVYVIKSRNTVVKLAVCCALSTALKREETNIDNIRVGYDDVVVACALVSKSLLDHSDFMSIAPSTPYNASNPDQKSIKEARGRLIYDRATAIAPQPVNWKNSRDKFKRRMTVNEFAETCQYLADQGVGETVHVMSSRHKTAVVSFKLKKQAQEKLDGGS